MKMVYLRNWAEKVIVCGGRTGFFVVFEPIVPTPYLSRMPGVVD
jgi:hypothetical protein